MLGKGGSCFLKVLLVHVHSMNDNDNGPTCDIKKNSLSGGELTKTNQ